jgi:hypothetical protein
MTPLSPEAQAIWDAFTEDEAGVFVDYGDKLAAALRAAADQVVPVEVWILRRGMRPGGTGSIAQDEFKQDQRKETRLQLLAIASELEGHQ